jgi:hypothetical protein
MGQSPTSTGNTTNLREDPNRWLWIPIFGIVVIDYFILCFLVVIGTAAVEGFHQDPILCGVGIIYIAGCVCGGCGWLIVQRKRIYPFLCDVGYTTAGFARRTVRWFSSVLFAILVLVTGLTFVLWLLSGVACLFSSLDSFMEAPIGTKVGAELGLFPSLWFPLLVVLIVLAIACCVMNKVVDKLNPAKVSQPQP